jgi:hypothetical protein
MLHQLAAGEDGELVVAVFGEDPTRINPKTGKKGLPVHSAVLRFRVGDVEANVDAIMKYHGVEHANIYMPLLVVHCGLTGNARGAKKDIAAVLGLTADMDADTGKAGEFPFEPSFEIETSPGNFQPAIVFDRPVKPEEAEPLAKALQKATGGDFGTGDIAHVWRVPGTLNWPNAKKLERGRSPDPAPVRLSRPWCVAKLPVEVVRATLGLKAKGEEPHEAAPDQTGPTTEESDDPEAILARLPLKTRDDICRVATADEDRSRRCMRAILSMIREGLSDTEIHTVTEAYPDGPFGRYHLEGKNLDDDIKRIRVKFAARVSPELNFGHTAKVSRPNDLRPTIQIVPGGIEKIVDEAEQALIDANRGLYLHGNRIVFVENGQAITSEGKKIVRQRISERGEHALVEDLSSAAIFQMFDARAKRQMPRDPSLAIVRILQQRRDRLRFPLLRGVINAPTLRADGSILDRPGYDNKSRLLFAPLGTNFPSIPDRPGRAEAESALAILSEPIKDFPFVSVTDRAVALSAILTACVRCSLPTAPLHGFSSPVAGSGKSKLVDISCVITTGREAGVVAQGRTEEELEKRLGSLLLSGEHFIAIDNCENPLGGEFLCTLLTQEHVRTRVLGKSEAPELPSSAFVTATGNNLTLEGDLTRRALLCQLDPKSERPELRPFACDPVAEAKANRPKLVIATLTILRAYDVAGKPALGLTPLGSFEAWSSLVRGALVWLGEHDPVDSMEGIRARDPRRETLRAVATAWHASVGDGAVTTTELIARAKAHSNFSGVRPVESSSEKNRVDSDLCDALLAVAGQGNEVNAKRLGRWLAHNKDRIVDGLRIVKTGERQGFGLWRVEATHTGGSPSEAR